MCNNHSYSIENYNSNHDYILSEICVNEFSSNDNRFYEFITENESTLFIEYKFDESKK